VEHCEIFWSLFAVDMNSILSQQPADTWESFPLFQVLNNYLRLDGTSEKAPTCALCLIPVHLCACLCPTENMCNGRFHTHLRDTFAPQVVRYIDLMESSIAQSLHRGFEREKWEVKR
jgi:hypothetical protein